jgi:integrase
VYKQGGDVREDLIDRIEESLNKLREIHFALAVQTHAAFVSFLKHNGVILGAAAFEIPSPKREAINPEYIPNDDEFESLLRFARLCRDRFLLMFHRYGGSRVGAEVDPVPLTLRHVLDLELEAVEKGEVKLNHETSCAVLIYASFKDKEIIRTPETYITFLPPRAMQLLKEYLEERMRSGERLTPESYLFRTYENGAEISFLTKQMADITVGRICRRAGYVIKYTDENGKQQQKPKFTIHSLRRLFYNSLSGVEDVDREALMGHVRGVRARYYGTVDDLVRAVEFMRQKYELGMRVVMGMSDEEVRMKALLDFAKTLGVSDEKIVAIREQLGHACTIDDLRQALSKELDHLVYHATDGGTHYASKLVTEAELLDYVNAGWEVLKELSSGKILIRMQVGRA